MEPTKQATAIGSREKREIKLATNDTFFLLKFSARAANGICISCETNGIEATRPIKAGSTLTEAR